MKGVAIACVVMLHVLSSLPGKIFTTSSAQPFFVFLDQFGRLCVPVFIGLSGYAFTRKYQKQFHLGEFLQRRVFKLAPLYLLWSVLFWQLFLQVPIWYSVEVPLKWWQVIFLGYGDYHLYFVPLIFQLYLLFPFLLWMVKRFSVATLVLSVGIQVLTIYSFRNQLPTMQYGSDQAQYSLVLAWIGYFVFGMVWGLDHWKQKVTPLIPILGTWSVSLAFLTWFSVQQINGGTDPLYALKFTRLAVLPYGFLSILLALRLPWERLSLPIIVRNFWIQLGVWSFVIYLSHTLLLRILFQHRWPALQPNDTALAVCVLIFGVFASYFLEKSN